MYDSFSLFAQPKRLNVYEWGLVVPSQVSIGLSYIHRALCGLAHVVNVCNVIYRSKEITSAVISLLLELVKVFMKLLLRYAL